MALGFGLLVAGLRWDGDGGDAMSIWRVTVHSRDKNGRIAGYCLTWQGERLSWLYDGYNMGWYRYKRDATNAAHVLNSQLALPKRGK